MHTTASSAHVCNCKQYTCTQLQAVHMHTTASSAHAHNCKQYTCTQLQAVHMHTTASSAHAHNCKQYTCTQLQAVHMHTTASSAHAHNCKQCTCTQMSQFCKCFLLWEPLNCHVERTHVYCPSCAGVPVRVRMLHIASNVWSQEIKKIEWALCFCLHS